MRIARVVVEVEPDHLDRPFDYVVPEGEDVGVGSRVEVIFAGRRVRGLVVETGRTTDVDPSQLREIRRALGPHAWAKPEEIDLLRWAATRYAAPLAAVVRHALPARVVDVERRATAWFPPGTAPRPDDPAPPTVDDDAWAPYGEAGARLRKRVAGGALAAYWRPLPGEDLAARVVELAGIALSSGRDVLLVVPEPVSSVADAVTDTFGELSVDVRGEMGTRATYRAWLRSRCGVARIVVGERGVAFWPLERLGLGIVVDEASPALKERRAPRHSAREVVLERCRRSRAVGLLVGHVPSAIAWRHLAERRIQPVVPAVAVERERSPTVRVDDRTDPRGRGRIGRLALSALRDAVREGGLGVVLVARRGEGRALACSRCGLRAACPSCDSSLAGADVPSGALCEGCGWQPEADAYLCARCGSSRHAPVAAGARRYGEELRSMLPSVKVEVLEGYAQEAPSPPAVVVMTRGSALVDPPGAVGAVVVPDIEAHLRRPALDAAEDTLRLSMRVAGWVAGEAEPRTVVVQTRDPGHHAVQALVRWDPGGFWRAEAARRAELRFPPAAHAVRLHVVGEGAEQVARDLAAALPDGDAVLGPRHDADRAGFLLKSADRGATVDALRPLRTAWSAAGLDVRIDVDPVDVL